MKPGTSLFPNAFGRAVLVFLCAKLFVGSFALAAGHDPLDPVTYARWDSGHYLTIASRGYSFAPCPPGDPARWCGNTAWLPGYPLLIRGLERIGLAGPVGGLLVTAAAHLALLWWIARRVPIIQDMHGWLILALAGLFPGMIYYHAIFPIALFTLCALLCLEALETDRPGWTFVWGLCAALAYGPGLLLAPVAGLRMLAFSGKIARKLGRGVLAATGPLIGFALALTIQFMDTGEPFAFFHLQRQYGRDFDPVGVLTWLIEQAWTSPFSPVRIAASQSLFVASVTLVTLWFARPSRSTVHLAAYLYLALLWLFFISIGRGISLYRSEACLMPAFILLYMNMNRPRVLFALFTCFLLLAGLLCDLFFRGMLV